MKVEPKKGSSSLTLVSPSSDTTFTQRAEQLDLLEYNGVNHLWTAVQVQCSYSSGFIHPILHKIDPLTLQINLGENPDLSADPHTFLVSLTGAETPLIL